MKKNPTALSISHRRQKTTIASRNCQLTWLVIQSCRCVGCHLTAPVAPVASVNHFAGAVWTIQKIEFPQLTCAVVDCTFMSLSHGCKSELSKPIDFVQVCPSDIHRLTRTTVTAVVAVSVRYMIDEINTSVFIIFCTDLNRPRTGVGNFTRLTFCRLPCVWRCLPCTANDVSQEWPEERKKTGTEIGHATSHKMWQRNKSLKGEEK